MRKINNEQKNKMKLHEAIEQVLISSNTPLDSIQIAEKINVVFMYRRKDGRKVPSSQILARAKNYNIRFNVSEGLISLKANE